MNYHCEEGKSYDATIGISLKKTDRNNATTLLPVVTMASYRYSTLLEEIRYIPVIDAKRTCLPNYPNFSFKYLFTESPRPGDSELTMWSLHTVL